jgi:hypothetical protein
VWQAHCFESGWDALVAVFAWPASLALDLELSAAELAHAGEGHAGDSASHGQSLSQTLNLRLRVGIDFAYGRCAGGERCCTADGGSAVPHLARYGGTVDVKRAELLSAAIEASRTDDLDESDAERLVASLDV